MRQRTDLLIALALALFAFLLYANSIPNNYNLDDELVTNHQRLTSQGISAIPEIFTSSYFDNQAGNHYEYRPVTLSSFAIEHTLFNENPHTSHAINVLLYAITIMLLYFTLRSVLPGNSQLVSLITTLFFAALPIHTEVVDSIKNRDEILCFMGGILAWRYAHQFINQERRTWQLYLLFIFFFTFGVLSKRSILSFAFLIPMALVWFQPVPYKKLLLIVLPLAAGFYLLSPSMNIRTNLAAVSLIFIVPIVLKNIFATNIEKYFTPPPIIVFGRYLKRVFTFIPASATDAKEEQKSTSIDKSGWLWCSVYALASLGYLYLLLTNDNVRLQAAGLLFMALLALSAVASVRPALALVAVLLGIATGAYHGSLLFLRALLFIPAFIIYYWQGRYRWAALAVLAINYLVLVCLWPKVGQLMNNGLLLLLQVALIFLKGRKQNIALVMLLLVLAAINAATNTTYPHEWLIPLSLAVYVYLVCLPGFKRFVLPLLLLLMAPVYILNSTLAPSISPFKKGQTTLFEGRYMLPVEEGSKVNIAKTPAATLVPAAGRELDFVENPLVKSNNWQERTATPFAVIGTYLEQMVLPLKLSFYYGYNQVPLVTWHDTTTRCVFAIFIILMFGSLFIRLFDPITSFATVYLGISLLFISNLFVPVAGMVAERLAFTGSLGFCLIWSSSFSYSKFNKKNVTDLNTLKGRPWLIVQTLVLLAIGVVLTFNRNYDWKDRLTLYSHDIKHLGNSAKAQQLLGYEYLQLAAATQNKTEQATNMELAKMHLLRAIEIAPEFHSPVYNMAYLYAIKDSCTGAIPWLERSLKLEPYLPEALFHYSICLENLGRLPEAAASYENTLKQNPKCLDCYLRLSYIHYRMGRLDQAIAVNKEAISYFPNSFELQVNLAKTYLGVNDNASALQYFQNGFRLHPDDVNLALAIADVSNRMGDKATSERYMQIAKGLGAR